MQEFTLVNNANRNRRDFAIASNLFEQGIGAAEVLLYVLENLLARLITIVPNLAIRSIQIHDH